MSRTDVISDAFTMIRNAALARHEEVSIPYSKLLVKICEILKTEGYLQNFKEIELGNFKKIKAYLKYVGKKNAIKKIAKVSKPGRRVYVKREDVLPVLNGYGISIVSTSKGILTDREAREKGLGGEIIGVIW